MGLQCPALPCRQRHAHAQGPHVFVHTSGRESCLNRTTSGLESRWCLMRCPSETSCCWHESQLQKVLVGQLPVYLKVPSTPVSSELIPIGRCSSYRPGGSREKLIRCLFSRCIPYSWLVPSSSEHNSQHKVINAGPTVSPLESLSSTKI